MDRMTELFFELFSGLPRQGPGDAASTRRALGLVPGISSRSRLLDLGCGTGMQTLLLAECTGARVVAIDNHPPFVEELLRKARARGLSERIDARVGDMRQLELAPGSFDLVWSEGAIYAMGFERGLRAWRGLLAEGGHLAVSEAVWLRPEPPAECRRFWEEEYPAIRDVPALLGAIEDCGYQTVGHFTEPAASWWDDYYRPLQENVTRFRAQRAQEPDALELADRTQREIDVWHAFSDFYSYEFFVLRAC